MSDKEIAGAVALRLHHLCGMWLVQWLAQRMCIAGLLALMSGREPEASVPISGRGRACPNTRPLPKAEVQRTAEGQAALLQRGSGAAGLQVPY
jgi:hypothetical protein